MFYPETLACHTYPVLKPKGVLGMVLKVAKKISNIEFYNQFSMIDNWHDWPLLGVYRKKAIKHLDK